MSRGGGSGLDWLAIIRGIIVVGFSVFVLLPAALRVIGFILNPSTDGFPELIAGLVIPWWIQIAIAAPVLLVIFYAIAEATGTEGVF